MQMRKAGNSGLMLSRLALGTMTWGRDTDEHEAADQCRAFIDAGGNFIDTAATYGDGDSERVIGGLIGTLFQRDDVVIATKAGLTFPDGVRTVDNSRHALIADLDRSLARLGTDFVDIWQVHTWDPFSPIDDTLSALDYAYSSGRARYVGLSNFTGWQLAQSATKQISNSAKAPITTIQSEYSLLNRDVARFRAKGPSRAALSLRLPHGPLWSSSPHPPWRHNSGSSLRAHYARHPS